MKFHITEHKQSTVNIIVATVLFVHVIQNISLNAEP